MLRAVLAGGEVFLVLRQPFPILGGSRRQLPHPRGEPGGCGPLQHASRVAHEETPGGLCVVAGALGLPSAPPSPRVRRVPARVERASAASAASASPCRPYGNRGAPASCPPAETLMARACDPLS